MGGYPTSTDIAQNLSTLAIVPMALAGEQAGYHLLHAAMFLALPAFVWWDISREDREAGVVAGGFACLFVAGYFATLGNSGDTNSLAGVLCGQPGAHGQPRGAARLRLGRTAAGCSASRSACTHTRRSSCTP